MDTKNFFNFMLGLSGQIAEETYKLKSAIDSEYSRIMTIGTNNNSDIAIAIRETTDIIVVFIEDLQYKFSQS
ncbi:MAG: hypothetical protein IPL26_27170 [Leptospiraceae bacterium]|nr:hypothetical protein [Leptospiraceae bacterium]